jgi:outer membrane protein TolC
LSLHDVSPATVSRLELQPPPKALYRRTRSALRLARQRYASGLIDFRAVLDTQRTLLSTQDGVESTRASLSADLVRLYKAFGGGWSPGLETVAGDTSAWSDKP